MIGHSVRKLVSKFFTRPTKQMARALPVHAVGLEPFAPTREPEWSNPTSEPRKRTGELHRYDPKEWQRRKRRRVIARASRQRNRSK